ncbi:MAG: GNAT family N-acetyltransferase [Planctomycetaceae bacterium]
MPEVREAKASDVLGIRDVFMTTYGEEYPYHEFLEPDALTRMVFSDNSILLVAVEPESQKVLGTASVVMDVGAFGDLTAEFGRLAVHPDARGQGVGGLLMEARLRYARDRIHVGIVENRVAHAFSQRISLRYGFVPVGFLPWKLRFIGRESVALYLQHFGEAVALRRNHPRVIPEAFPLAEFSLRNLGIRCDAVVTDSAVSYPHIEDFELQEMSTDGYATLLRLQRGRVHRREVFGPVRLHYGLFQLQARRCNYLIARRSGTIVGAIGFLHDKNEKSVRVVELLSVDDQPIHFLIRSLETSCREDWQVEYIEVDVNAYAPQMQQTFLECGFLPCGYLPAIVFHEVERLDSVRMARLLVPPEIPEPEVTELAGPIAQHVLSRFRRQGVVPAVSEAMGEVVFFEGMTDEQAVTVAEICRTATYQEGDEVFRVDGEPAEMFLVLRGRVGLFAPGQTSPCGIVERDLIGESSIVSPRDHTLAARALSDCLLAVIDRGRLEQLLRRRTDIAMILYRNLARSLAQKLRRSRSECDLY